MWQKNEVFTADIIQPLFDLANSGSDLHRQVEEQVKRGENQNAAGGKAAPKAGSIQVVNQNNSSGGNQNSGNYTQYLKVSKFRKKICSPRFSKKRAFFST